MLFRLLLVISVLALIQGCQSTSKSTETKVLKPYLLERVQLASGEQPIPVNYVYRAAKLADKRGYRNFALVNEQKFDNKMEIFLDKGIKALMFNDGSEQTYLKELSAGSYRYQLYGIFSTDEYKDSKRVPIGNIPGAA